MKISTGGEIALRVFHFLSAHRAATDDDYGGKGLDNDIIAVDDSAGFERKEERCQKSGRKMRTLEGLSCNATKRT